MAEPEKHKSVLLSEEPRPSTADIEWVRYTRRNAAMYAEKVAAFKPLDVAAGHAATEWLREKALDLHEAEMTATRLAVSESRLEGFIATSYGVVELTHSGFKELGIPHPLRRDLTPAFILAWVARHEDSDLRGIDLVATAYGLGREAATRGGLPCFALDPHDDETAERWQAKPYYFRKAKQPEDPKKRPRLWTPMGAREQ